MIQLNNWFDFQKLAEICKLQYNIFSTCIEVKDPEGNTLESFSDMQQLHSFARGYYNGLQDKRKTSVNHVKMNALLLPYKYNDDLTLTEEELSIKATFVEVSKVSGVPIRYVIGGINE